MSGPIWFERKIVVYLICLAQTTFYVSSQDPSPDYGGGGGGNYVGSEPGPNNYDKCDLPFLGNDMPRNVPEGLVRMGPNSKYFTLKDTETMSISDVDAFCASLGLQPADIRNKFELISIENFMMSFGNLGVPLSLGLNDEEREGDFREYDGTPMQFHAFAEQQPNSVPGEENCIALTFHPDLGRLVYMDSPCDMPVNPMCMFPSSHECFFSSPLTTAKVEETFDYVGSTELRDYFVYGKQLSRAAAESTCGKSGLQLVDFNTGLSNNQMLYDLLKKWLTKNYIFTRIAVWTGAKLIPAIGGKKGSMEFTFQSSGRPLSDLSEWPSLLWDNDEPAISVGLKDCITAILYKPYSASGDNFFSLSATNCRIPQYPLCYRDKSVIIIKPPEEDLEARSESSKPDQICPLPNVKLNLALEELSLEEVAELSRINRHEIASLGADNLRFKWEIEKPWLSAFFDAVMEAGKKASPVDVVPHDYANIITNLMILYYNGIHEVMQISDPDEEIRLKIENATAFLVKCTDDVITPLKMDFLGGLPTTWEGTTVIPILDLADDFNRDLILDSYWFYFLTAVGSCYPKAQGSKTQWLLEIHDLFVNAFIGMFEQRWLNLGGSALDYTRYGVFMGDFEVENIFYSLRITSVTAFLKSGITDLYFPRPIYVPDQFMDRMNQKKSKAIVLNK